MYNDELEDCELLAELETIDTQYNRMYIRVYRCHGGQYKLLVNDNYDPQILDVTSEIIRDVETGKITWEEYLKDIVINDWDYDCPEIEWLSQWGLLNLDDYVICGPNYCDYEDGEVCVWVHRCYCGHDPSGLLRDENGEIRKFTDCQEARKWIEENGEGRYVLAHGEAGRPTYYIISLEKK